MATPPKSIIKRYRRFTGWDYSRGASLFITVATAGRHRLFGRVVGGKMALSPLGAAVYDAIGAIAALNPGVLVFGRVVMPDHVHFNVHLEAGLNEPLKVLGNAIRRFKNYTTKLAKLAEHQAELQAEHSELAEHSSAIITTAGGAAAGGACSDDGQTVFGQKFGQLWQQGYHDRLCLTRAFIDATERYIAYNPLKWELMYGASGGLRVTEPLDSPRLDGGDYWKGVGNVALLDDKLCSLRVSREVRSLAQIAAVVSRLRDAVAKGYTILSGFVSPGEKAVCEMLCKTPGARFIRILPSCLPNARYKPESRYVAPFAEKRYLEIAKGNDEVEFSRRACLDYNAEIVEIACAGEGLALYWKADGPHRVGLGV